MSQPARPQPSLLYQLALERLEGELELARDLSQRIGWVELLEPVLRLLAVVQGERAKYAPRAK